MPTETIAAVEIDLYRIDTETIVTHYFAERGFVTRATDTPANTFIPGRLVGPIEVERAIRSGPGNLFGSLADMTFSSLVLENGDGALDDLVDDYASDGREVRIRVGTVSHNVAWQAQPAGGQLTAEVLWATDASGVDTLIIAPGGDALVFEAAVLAEAGEVAPYYDADEIESYAGFQLAFRCLGGQWEADERVLRLRLRDPGVALQGTLQLATYAGTGGREGGANLTGVTKPLALGFITMAPLVEISIEGGTGNFHTVYACHAGRVEDIIQLTDMGMVVTIAANYATLAALVAATIPVGQCATCEAEGLIRFHTVPTVPAATLFGDASSGSPPWTLATGVFWPDDGGILSSYLNGYVSSVGGVLRRVLALYGRGPVHDGRLDTFAFDAFTAGAGSPIGWFLEAGGSDSCEDVVEAIAYGAHAVVGPDRLLTYTIFPLVAPDTVAPVATFTEREILDVERLPLPYGVQPHKWQANYLRVWRPHREDELADLVGQATRQLYQNEWRSIVNESEAVWRRNPSGSGAPPIDTPFTTGTDAAADVNGRRAFYGDIMFEGRLVTRGLWRVRLATSVLALDLGDVVTVSCPDILPDGTLRPRFGLGAGRRLMVVRVRDSLGGDDTACEFEGFG
jgi:hypothetical protein